MPAKAQRGTDSEPYESDMARFMELKSEAILLSIRPVTLENAKEWLGAANEFDAPLEVKEHFYEEVQRLK